MAVAAQDLFSLPSIMLLTAAESILAYKSPLVQFIESKSLLSTALVIFTINFLVYAILWVVAYPYFFSPLRSLPGPKVYWKHPGCYFYSSS